MGIESWLVPIVAIIFGCSIPMLAIYMNAKKDILLIEKGLYTLKPMPIPPRGKLLIAGSILVGTGVAIFLGIYWEIGLGAWTMGGLIPCFIGIALLVSYKILKEK